MIKFPGSISQKPNVKTPSSSSVFVIFLAIGFILGARPVHSPDTNSTASAQDGLLLIQIASGLADPVAITHAGDGSDRLFITLQAGQIVIHDGIGILPEPFLDITDRVNNTGSEEGLLSVAFPPDYASEAHFYVYYTDLDGNNVVARFGLTADPDVADPGSEQIVLPLDHPVHTNHNGGQLAFGPDGYLYVGPGDGGSAGDPDDNAQNPASLLGKLLRIDVESGNPLTYTIPASNPFEDVPGYRDEIWALGLRNPWRFSFDRLTGDLLTGDVGQYEWEEVDFQPASSTGGENYGWRRMEGKHCYNPPSDCNDGSLTLPILEYDHGLGCAITGGYRYRGPEIPHLNGTYLYADYCSGRIWGATEDGSGNWTTTELLNSPYIISTLGEDEAGEVYFAHLSSTNGEIYRIAGATVSLYLPLIPKNP